MSYDVKVKFPKIEEDSQDKVNVQTREEQYYDQDYDEVLDLYGSFERQGYKVAVTFKTEGDVNYRDIANTLEQSDIAYRASLKFKNNSNKGLYDTVSTIASITLQQGFDFDVSATLKINEESTIDFDHENTWFSEDATYQVKPKAKSKDLAELIPLYERLTDAGFDVMFDIKPKAATSEDEFAVRLAAYPAGTEITFRLTDSEF